MDFDLSRYSQYSQSEIDPDYQFEMETIMMIQATGFDIDPLFIKRKKPLTQDCGASLELENDNGEKRKVESTCFLNCIFTKLGDDPNYAFLGWSQDEFPVSDEFIMNYSNLRSLEIHVFEPTIEKARIFSPEELVPTAKIQLWLEGGHYTLIIQEEYE